MQLMYQRLFGDRKMARAVVRPSGGHLLIHGLPCLRLEVLLWMALSQPRPQEAEPSCLGASPCDHVKGETFKAMEGRGHNQQIVKAYRESLYLPRDSRNWDLNRRSLLLFLMNLLCQVRTPGLPVTIKGKSLLAVLAASPNCT